MVDKESFQVLICLLSASKYKMIELTQKTSQITAGTMILTY